jgi:hypothetical protein
MEQLYYTQCPVGYGVGASGGLQIKRCDGTYPLAGDVRHLGLRAFLGTSRALAPPVLRYRRDGEIAEVARLTPREKEYHTERGLWGRPGGYFAHSLRLTMSELGAIANWPAGLLGWPHWCVEDLEPSHGDPPRPIAEPWPQPFVPPEFETISARASGKSVERVAELLTALADSVREGRCLFVIDEADRLNKWVELLTFAFPEALRAALTFSTYHDRPEELLGFRLQGTLPQVRPNRAALAGLGVVADLVSGTMSPAIEPAAWALSLARWLVEGGPDSAASWSRVDRLVTQAAQRGILSAHKVWTDQWLDHLMEFEASTQSVDIPTSDDRWKSLDELTTWVKAMALDRHWLEKRPTSWWLSAARASDSSFARSAVLAQLRLPAAWQLGSHPAVDWGRVVATWFETTDLDERAAALEALLIAAPESSRASALASIIRTWPEATGSEVLERLASSALIRPAMRLPLMVRGAVGVLRDQVDPAPLVDVLTGAFEIPEALVATLDAIAIEVVDHDEWLEIAAKALAGLLSRAQADLAAQARNWALAQGASAASKWLGPDLRGILADPSYPERIKALWSQTPPRMRPILSATLLSVARDPNLGREVFPWVVEHLLLVIPEEHRPRDASWAEDYLARVGSGYELMRKLYLKETRNPELRRWIKQAHQQGKLSERQVAQLGRCQAFYQVLDSGQASGLRGSSLPTVPHADRGPMLEEMIRRLGHASFEGLDFCLDSCRIAWPNAFVPGAPGLRGIGVALAWSLRELRANPVAWFERLVAILDRLKLTLRAEGTFEPDGLAAEIVAASTRGASNTECWTLRSFLLNEPSAWKILSTDAALELVRADPKETLTAFRMWDSLLPRGTRLFELLLNSCDPDAMVAIVSGAREEGSSTPWAAEFRTLPALPWWGCGAATNNDLRDRLAIQAPMNPLGEESLTQLTLWMGSPQRVERGDQDLDEDLTPIDDKSSRRVGIQPGLSSLGQARWACLHALTVLNRRGLDSTARWTEVLRWSASDLPLRSLSTEDRRRFLGWMILRTDFWDALPLDRDDRAVAKIASWLRSQGFNDREEIDGLKRWDGPLIDRVDAAELRSAQAFRPKFVDALWWSLRQEVAADSGVRGKSSVSRSP